MTSLGQWLAARGLRVDDTDVPVGRTSTWTGVRWITVHHTAGSCSTASEAREAAYIRRGGDAPPLAHLMLGASGTVWVCCRPRGAEPDPGRASHMGVGGPYRDIPAGRGNETCLGIEVQCSGTHPLATHTDQYATLIRLLAVLCDRYGLTADRILGHKEWAPGRKIDPRDDMDTIRAAVAAELARPTTPPPTPHRRQRMFLVQQEDTKGVLIFTGEHLVPVPSPADRDALTPILGPVAVISASQMAHLKQAGHRGFAGGGVGEG